MDSAPAWAASDTLSAAAAGLEGDAGGPITDAAAAFDRAGRDVYRRIPVRTDTGTALRTAGRMIALLSPDCRRHHACRRSARRRDRGVGVTHGGRGGTTPVSTPTGPSRGRLRLYRAATPGRARAGTAGWSATEAA